jgi:hypothetical protein
MPDVAQKASLQGLMCALYQEGTYFPTEFNLPNTQSLSTSSQTQDLDNYLATHHFRRFGSYLRMIAIIGWQPLIRLRS